MKFIKALILLIGCTTHLISIKAQQTTISIGTNVGVNLSKLSVKSTDTEATEGEFKSLTGHFIGLPIEARFSDQFALQAELNFIRHGLIYRDQDLYFENNDQISDQYNNRAYIDYLEFPVLAKLLIPLGTESEIYFLAGPSIAFAIDGKIKYETRTFRNGQLVDHLIEEVAARFDSGTESEFQIKRFDYGLEIGTGAALNLGKGRLLVGIRYKVGLSNINNCNGGEGSAVYNRSVACTLGYLISLHKPSG